MPPSATPGLARINSLPADELTPELLTCLDVPRWAADIVRQRPFATASHLYRAADTAAPELTEDEIHRALAAHPRIGERPPERSSTAAWSRSEQSGVDPSDEQLMRQLREANAEYERRFGHVYLVCASGRSGAELLAILKSRLDNDPETELAVVADELRKIARLRLTKVVEQ